MPIPHASQALSRFTVLDLTRVRSGPTCVRQLADWGANVIKIDALLEDAGGEQLGGARSGSDFQNLHRNKRAMTLNLKDPRGLETFKRLVKKADVVVENFRPDVKAKLGIDYESVRKINPAHRLWQHFRLRPGWPLSQASRLRSDRAGHGRADVDHRRPRRGPDAGRHSRGRSHRRAVLRDGHPDRAAGARRLRRRPVGADLAAAGPDLHAGFPGLALADGKGRGQAGRQRPSDQHSHRRVQDLRRLYQHRHRGGQDLGALRAGARRARPSETPRIRHRARTARRTARRSMRRSTSSPKRNRPTPGSRN